MLLLLLMMMMMMMMMTMMVQYKTEKDGVIETRIEKRLVLTGTAADVDHDKVNTSMKRSFVHSADLCRVRVSRVRVRVRVRAVIDRYAM